MEHCHDLLSKSEFEHELKHGIERKAKLLFSQADEDDSGLLSIIEIFCILPSIENMLKTDLRKLDEGEVESCSEAYSESDDDISIRNSFSFVAKFQYFSEEPFSSTFVKFDDLSLAKVVVKRTRILISVLLSLMIILLMMQGTIR